MPAPFAALQDRVNGALDRHLTNALAQVEGAPDPVPVEFDEPYAPSFDDQVDAQAPECWGPAAALGGLERGDSLLIDGRPFEVLRSKPDGTGRVHLILRGA
ncbi:hypothetical protein [uncultured Variovorax sp.]|uniref:head-tail joining protein n=1 Tax=uncultured Variovorax sp. TaxID=114708 RepID=UPI0025E892ED|nr:hypothetical protein [uncultured Variovorax sp.]